MIHIIKKNHAYVERILISFEIWIDILCFSLNFEKMKKHNMYLGHCFQR